MAGGDPYFLYLARHLSESWNAGGNCGLVAGATWPAEMAALRAAAPTLPFLVPGIGAQGGDLAGSVGAGRTAAGGGLLISASRGIMQASDPAAAAAAYAQAMIAAAQTPPTPVAATDANLDRLLVDLFDAGIIRFEPITLKSGRVSPYYHNLRGLVAHPTLLRRVAAVYAARVRALGWTPDILIGIAYAGIPLAVALGQALDLPAGYVRAEAKPTVRARWSKAPGPPACTPC